MHDAAYAFDFCLGLGCPFHDRLDFLHPTTFHDHAAVSPVGDGVDQFIIHAIHPLQRLGHIENLGQRGLIEDRAFFDLQHQHDGVGSAKGRRVGLMDLNEGVVLRQLLVKPRDQVKLDGKRGKDQGGNGNEQ